MNEEIEIREVTEQDAVSLQVYIANLFTEGLPSIFHRDTVPTIEQELEFLLDILQDPHSVGVVAVSNGAVVGMLHFSRKKQPQLAHSGVFGLSVAKAWRRKRIGTSLINRLVDWAGAQPVRRIELEVFSNNAVAIDLYEKLGFVREGQKVGAVEVAGDYIDLIQMVRHLQLSE